MSNHVQTVEKVKAQLDRLGSELDELDHKLKTECRNASAWYGEQMGKLRTEWRDAQSKIERLSAEGQAEAQSAYQTAADDAERHWKALKAAVQTYRQQVETNVAASKEV